MLRRHAAALALAATTLAASGCGGSPSTGSTDTSTSATPSSSTATGTTTTAATETTSGKPMTRAEILIAKAGAICGRIKARHRALNFKTQQDIAREIPLFASYQQAVLTELSKLTPPTSMTHEWKRFAAATQALANDTTRLGEYVKTNRFSATGPILARINKDESDVKTHAARDGIVGCVRIY